MFCIQSYISVMSNIFVDLHAKKPSPHRGSLGSAQPQSLPFQGRWLGEAETERSYQICSNLSVSLRLPAPLKGEPFRCGGLTPQALRASSP